MNVAHNNLESPVTNAAEQTVLNVLVLDDVETDRIRIGRYLRKAGLQFNLFEAADLASFREQIDHTQMDLVFLDYLLDMDTGLDALKLLSAHEEQVNALPIMITSVDRCDVAVEAMRNGCADYLVKEQLSVEAVRKSIISAFERRILISALSQAQTSRQVVRKSVSRFARTCGPDIRAVLAATLRHVRITRQNPELDENMTTTLSKLEGNCQEIFGFFDELASLLEELEASQSRTPKSVMDH